MPRPVIGNPNDSSRSLRPWLLMRQFRKLDAMCGPATEADIETMADDAP